MRVTEAIRGSADIDVAAQIWAEATGEADNAVPPAFGHWLADRIPGVDAHFPADDDHGSIHDRHLAEAYGWLRHHIGGTGYTSGP